MAAQTDKYITLPKKPLSIDNSQRLYVRNFADYVDTSSGTPTIDAFIRIGEAGATNGSPSVKLFVENGGVTTEIPFGTTLRINNGSNTARGSNEIVVTNSDPLSFIENYVYIVGQSGSDTKIYMNHSDSRGMTYESGSFYLEAKYNQQPKPPEVATSISDQNATEGSLFSYTIPTSTFIDPDTETLSYTASYKDPRTQQEITRPSWLSYNASTRTFTGTPPSGADDVLVEVTASDGRASASTTFVIKTPGSAVDLPPTLVTPIPDQQATEGSSFTYTIPTSTFRDPEGGVVSYTVRRVAHDGNGYSPLPSWLTFDSETLTFSGTPTTDTLDFTIEVTATDSAGNASTDRFVIATPGVSPPTTVNRAPQLVSPITNQSAQENAAFSFAVPNGTFIDPDTASGQAAALTYSALYRASASGAYISQPSWLSFNATTQTFSGTPPAGAADVYVELKATDSGGLYATTSFAIVTPSSNIIQLENDGNTLFLSPMVGTLVGGNGNDVVTIASAGSTLHVSGLESLTGGVGVDVVSISSGGSSIRVLALETLTGGSGLDSIRLGGGGNTTTVSAIETLTGGQGKDRIIVEGNGSTMQISALEVLIGGAGTDIIRFGNSGNTVQLRGLETVVGGQGYDRVVIGDTGTTMLVSALDVLVGGNGRDIVSLGGAGNTVLLRGLETLTGGIGTDRIVIGDTGASMRVSAIEVLVGGTGVDKVTFGNDGNTVTLRGLETLTGGSGNDRVVLGNTGNTMTLASGVETLVGGTGKDVVRLGSSTTIIMRSIETLLGSAGEDFVSLGLNVENAITVSSVEVLSGGYQADTITVTSGTLAFHGRSGADVVTLKANSEMDQIEYGTDGDGSSLGATSGYDQIANFESGNDQLVISNELRTLLDKNGDSDVSGATRTANTVNFATDDVVTLSGAVSSLTNYAALGSALGSVSNPSENASVLVLANNGSSTGAYLITDGDASGQIAASEVRLLSVFSGTTSITHTSVVYG